MLDLQAVLTILFTSVNNAALALALAPILTQRERWVFVGLFAGFDALFSYLSASAAGYLHPLTSDDAELLRGGAFIAIGAVFLLLALASQESQVGAYLRSAKRPGLLLFVPAAALLSTDNLATGAAVGLAEISVPLYSALTGLTTAAASYLAFIGADRLSALRARLPRGLAKALEAAPSGVLILAGVMQILPIVSGS